MGPPDITIIFRQTHEGDVVNEQYDEMNNHSNIVVLSPKCISKRDLILINSSTLLDPEIVVPFIPSSMKAADDGR